MPVYFARQGVTGNVKIGFATDIVKRIKQLQTGQPARLLLMRLFDGEMQDEKALHRRFSHLAIGGEWFRFHPDMTGDIGLVEIPAPQIGKYQRKYNWPSTPGAYWVALCKEVFTIIGGVNDVARRCGVPPWFVSRRGWDSTINPNWFSAVVLLLAERGRSDITYQMLVDAHKAMLTDERSEDERKARREIVQTEGWWIEKHPNVSPWWEVCPENKPGIEPSVRLVPDADNSGAA